MARLWGQGHRGPQNSLGSQLKICTARSLQLPLYCMRTKNQVKEQHSPAHELGQSPAPPARPPPAYLHGPCGWAGKPHEQALPLAPITGKGSMPPALKPLPLSKGHPCACMVGTVGSGFCFQTIHLGTNYSGQLAALEPKGASAHLAFQLGKQKGPRPIPTALPPCPPATQHVQSLPAQLFAVTCLFRCMLTTKQVPSIATSHGMAPWG